MSFPQDISLVKKMDYFYNVLVKTAGVNNGRMEAHGELEERSGSPGTD